MHTEAPPVPGSDRVGRPAAQGALFNDFEQAPDTRAAGGPRDAGPVRLPHFPALDGLRGLAVIVVLLFHGGVLQGGFVGVDVFFVLSGFLITTLLLHEWDASATIDLRTFWARRARRLLPAVLAVVAVVVGTAAILGRAADVAEWRADAVATLLYVANWRQILSEGGYWEHYGLPSPLRHTWSLAIEEQFYVLWPLVVFVVLRVTGGSRRILLAVTGTAAALSVAAMARLADEGAPDRAYLGTDTRAAAVLIGAAAALLFARRVTATAGDGADPGRRGARLAVDGLALLGVAVILVASVLADGNASWMYHGGFTVLEIVTALVLVAVATARPGPAGAVLGVAPLRWAGTISYGLYLWHWPVFVAVEAYRPTLDPSGDATNWLLVAKLAISLVLAVISYVAIEQPVRRQGLGAWRRPVFLPAVAGLAVVASLALVLVPRDDGGEMAGGVPGSETRGAGVEPPPIARDPELERVLAAPATSSTLPATVMAALPRPAGRRARVMVVGDSVGFYLGEALVQLADGNELVVANRSVIACAISTESSTRTKGPSGELLDERPQCREWQRTFAKDVQTFRPDVVLMAYGGPVPVAREINGSWADVCGDEYARWYREQIGRAVDLLGSTGATVAMVPGAYTRMPFLDWQDLDRRSDCMTKVYRQEASARPKARVVPFDQWVCPQGSCREEIDGVKLREDGTHYKGDAAKLVSQWLVDQVLEPPKPR